MTQASPLTSLVHKFPSIQWRAELRSLPPPTSNTPVRLYFPCSTGLCLHLPTYAYVHSRCMIKSHCGSFLERPVTVHQNLLLGQTPVQATLTGTRQR